MRKIVVASYMGSGSSAATDLLREFEDVQCPNGSYEYIFLHCPNGVFDLEDKLIANNNAIRSDEALRSFRASMSDLYGHSNWWFANYRSKLSPNFLRYVDQFIQSLTCCEYEGFWYEHEKVGYAASMAVRLLRKLGLGKGRSWRLYQDRMSVAFPREGEFYASAREFVDRSLSDLWSDNEQSALLLDQLFLPHNLYRMPSYFGEDAKALVVQRDPRDVFVLNKYVWLPRGCPVPFPLDARQFCDYYRAMRESVTPWNDDAVKEVWFEDLVLHYEEIKGELVDFFGGWLGCHSEPRSCFDPDKSIVNVGVYQPIDESAEEVRYIERHLQHYLYPGNINDGRRPAGIESMF